jgi:hypothetical protein
MGAVFLRAAHKELYLASEFLKAGDGAEQVLDGCDACPIPGGVAD